MAVKAQVYNQKGESKGDITLNSDIFGVAVNEGLMHQALVRQLANSRSAIAHVKTRGEVRGGGRKPHRQKGTGRARAGSSRISQWRGGGTTFGPRNTRNFSKAMPKKQRRKALFCALSSKANENGILILEKYDSDKIKAKDFAELIKKLPIERNVLVVIPSKNEVIQKSSRNLTNTKTILANYLNIRDILKYEKVLILKDALDTVEEVFLSKKKTVAKPAAKKA